MARFHPLRDITPILEAAGRWRDACLEGDGSLFGEESLWTEENARVLRRDFVERPDLGNGSFLEKLYAQLIASGSAPQKLAAEMHWALLLFQSNITPPKKREIISTIWHWSGDDLPESDLLGDPVLRGIGGTGQSFNNYRWKELSLLIELVLAIKGMPPSSRHQLLSDPWEFGRWIEALPRDGYRQLPNLLRYLLFPDHYERITVADQKRQILASLAPDLMPPREERDREGDIALDQGLHQLRQRIAAERGNNTFDFYDADLEPEWRTVSAWLLSWNPANWEWESFAADRTATASGRTVTMAWRCSSKKPEVDHQVYLFRAGTPPRGMIAKGRVVRSPYEADHYDNDAAQRGEKARFIDVAFDEIRDPAIDPFVSVDTLRDTFPEQQWSPYGSGIEIRPQALKVLEALWSQLPPVAAPVHPPLADGENGECLFTINDAMEGLFLERDEFAKMLSIWRAKKNLILQGAPGTGKSFLARRLAWALLGSRDDKRIETVQFHQSYGYEDFVQGYRPTETGGFELRDGAFYSFCRRAAADPDHDYVFIIDEINRGNLSKVFGELMLLIEHDKRRPEWAARLAYATDTQPRFHVPPNVLLLGMMNTADKSLSLVDYALRRRFAFVTLKPQFASPGFAILLESCGVEEALRTRLVARMLELNRSIADDTVNLGPGFQIGHSFFVPHGDASLPPDWFDRVVETEIRPLLEEYWFEVPEKAEHWCKRLVAP